MDIDDLLARLDAMKERLDQQRIELEAKLDVSLAIQADLLAQEIERYLND
jgi:hypothetical protein